MKSSAKRHRISNLNLVRYLDIYSLLRKSYITKNIIFKILRHIWWVIFLPSSLLNWIHKKKNSQWHVQILFYKTTNKSQYWYILFSQIVSGLKNLQSENQQGQNNNYHFLTKPEVHYWFQAIKQFIHISWLIVCQSSFGPVATWVFKFHHYYSEWDFPTIKWCI